MVFLFLFIILTHFIIIIILSCCKSREYKPKYFRFLHAILIPYSSSCLSLYTINKQPTTDHSLRKFIWFTHFSYQNGLWLWKCNKYFYPSTSTSPLLKKNHQAPPLKAQESLFYFLLIRTVDHLMVSHGALQFNDRTTSTLLPPSINHNS